MLFPSLLHVSRLHMGRAPPSTACLWAVPPEEKIQANVVVKTQASVLALACQLVHGGGCTGWGCKSKEWLDRSRGRPRPWLKEARTEIPEQLVAVLILVCSRKWTDGGQTPLLAVNRWLSQEESCQSVCPAYLELWDPAAVLQVLLNHCHRIAAVVWIIKPCSAESNDG